MSDWKLKRQILQVGAFLLVMVAVLSLYIGYLAVWEGQELAENPLNMRAAAAKADIRRGTIFDAHGRVMAQTQNDGTRSYPQGEVMAHITGYNGETPFYQVEDKFFNSSSVVAVPYEVAGLTSLSVKSVTRDENYNIQIDLKAEKDKT